MAEGFKQFLPSTVLDAADLSDFCSSQAVMRFANAAGRDAALTVSIVLEGMFAYLKDTNVLQVNTDGTLAGWQQIFPIITAGITDAQVTNAKLSTNSVASANIIDGTIVSADIAAGTITGANIAAATITGSNIQDGSIGPVDLAVDTYTINITGNAATASDSALLDGFDTSFTAVASTVAVRNINSNLAAGGFFSSAANQNFVGTGSFTSIGNNCARVDNSDTVFNDIVSGRAVIVSSAGTLGTASSSLRFKETIEPLGYTAADILKLRPVTYRYKQEVLEDNADRPVEVGLIAEELDALGFNELVYYGKDGPEGIAYERLAVILVKVCQDQQTQLDALHARLEAIGA